MAGSIFRITDGTTRIELQPRDGDGITCKNYAVFRTIAKDGGVWADSSLSDGRQLQMRKWTNAVDVLTLVISGDCQNDIIEDARQLTELLEKATQYWTTEWQNEPVWLERKAKDATNIEYTLIHGYKWENDVNPFSQPFSSITGKAMDDIELAIEHGPWMANAPGDSECTEISNLMSTGDTTQATATPTAQGDDCHVEHNGGTIDLTYTSLYLGSQGVVDFDIGIRFINVAVPAGATIISAYIYFYGTGNFSNTDPTVDIYGELNAAPAIFTTYANFVGRTRTASHVKYEADWAAYGTRHTPNIASVIQEIVDLGGWASGNDITMFLENRHISDPITVRTCASWDNTVYNPPLLVINYIDNSPAEAGRAETCLSEVYVSNKDNTAFIEHAYWYDTSAVNWSGNLIGAATPFDLFPNPIGVGDILYLGNENHPFCSAVFDIGTIGDTAITWEYWNGAWVALTVVDDKANYDQFTVEDVGALVWTHPSDWAKTIINGTNAYWVRARVTNAATITPTQQNRDIYTVTSSDIEIDESEIGGDITAIGKINTVTLDTTRGTMEKLIVSLRSTDRGDGFKQHINTDLQNDAYITITTDDADTGIQADIDKPTGSCLRTQFPANDPITRKFYFEFEPPLAQEYYGRYRAFMRAEEDTTSYLSDGDIKSYLNVAMGSERATKLVGNIGIGNTWHYFDYGIITIPPAIIPDIYEGTVRIDVYAQNDNANAIDFDWCDLILVPVDEYAFEINQNADVINNTGDITIADSLSYIGKSNIFSLLQYESDGEIYDIPKVIASGPIQFQANKDQRVFFYSVDASKYEWLGRIQVWHNGRYLTFRGDS